MVCSICGQNGHNRRTCPQRNTTGLVNPGIHNNRPVPPRDPPPNRLTMEGRRAITRKFWKKTIKTIILLKRFIKVSLNLHKNNENLKYSYFHWLKIKDLCMNYMNNNSFGDFIQEICGYFGISAILSGAHIICSEFHKNKNPVKDNSKKIKLINMRNENYLIYWVSGNLMVEDIDNRENYIGYLGMLRKNGTFVLNTMIGHRFYLVPHRLDLEPPYHPQTDKQFFIEPYTQLNIHPDLKKEIYIDEGDKLSELNRWKFNALKLDYLIREMIKLGAKNNETLDIVLDLHEDITLDEVGEWYKDIAGVPSTFTNIT